MKWPYPPMNFGVAISGEKDHRCWVCWIEKRPRKLRTLTTPTEISEATGTGPKGCKSLWLCLKHWQKYKKWRGLKMVDPEEGVIEMMEAKR